MIFTRQRLSVGQQASSSACSCTSPTTAQRSQWQATTNALCVPVGTRMQDSDCSGSAMPWEMCGSKPGPKTLAKTFLTMKNSINPTGNLAAKQGILVSSRSTMSGIEPHPDDQSFTEDKIFHKKPNLRVPETPEEENFRQFIKSNLPRPKASQALLQRIRSISQEPLD